MDTFPIIILIGRPAAGKSEVIDYIKKLPDDVRRAKLHIAPFEEIDDFVWVWQLFEDDDIREKLGRARVNTTPDYFFTDPFLWNFLIAKINLKFAKHLARDANLLRDHTIIVEFARGGENGFGEAFAYLSDEILARAAIVYVSVSYDESVRRNRRRQGQEDSILYHSLSDDKMEAYYKTNDWSNSPAASAKASLKSKGIRFRSRCFRTSRSRRMTQQNWVRRWKRYSRDFGHARARRIKRNLRFTFYVLRLEFTMQDLAKDFLAQKRIAIVGVTHDEKGWGRTLYAEFKKRGYETFAVNPSRNIPGLQCYGSLQELPTKPDGVLLVVPPNVTEQVVREVAELNIPRVWMHKGAGAGSVSEAAIQFCQEHNIATVYGVCPFMYLQPQAIGHKLHHNLAMWFGALPKGA